MSREIDSALSRVLVQAGEVALASDWLRAEVRSVYDAAVAMPDRSESHRIRSQLDGLLAVLDQADRLADEIPHRRRPER